MTYSNYIHDFLEYGKLLHQKNYIASCDGNISALMTEKPQGPQVLITRSGVMKSRLKPEDITSVNLQGELTSKTSFGQPSSELKMHLEIYQNQPLAKAVIHAHPPAAIALSVACPELTAMPLDYISELRLALGGVPIVPYQRPGTAQMGEALRPYLSKAKVMILARHGVVSWGENLEEAYRGIERLEHACDIYLRARALGPVNQLPEDEIEVLKQMRKDIGFKTL